MLKKALLRSIYIGCSIGFLIPGLSKAQGMQADTLQLDLQQTEKIFLEKNLALLAQQYNIDASKALIQQARLWDNPVLNTDQNVYANGKFFEHGTSPTGQPLGEFYVQVQQLIKTAGKRGKEIKLARTGADISQLQFDDVMRNLKLQLRTDFYTILQLESNQQLFNQQ
jgi:cobalt-zinc-cadmium efflux system outer membrane protein